MAILILLTSRYSRSVSRGDKCDTEVWICWKVVWLNSELRLGARWQWPDERRLELIYSIRCV